MQSIKTSISLNVNGKRVTAKVDPQTPLLYVLRNQMELNGPKYGCGLGQCGACMVLIDGQTSLSCVIPVNTVEDKKITTLAGISEGKNTLHPVQQAFIEEQAAQCGYCTNGMIISAIALLNNNSNPKEADIRQSLQTNLCRCGTQSRVIRAIQKATEKMS